MELWYRWLRCIILSSRSWKVGWLNLLRNIHKSNFLSRSLLLVLFPWRLFLLYILLSWRFSLFGTFRPFFSPNPADVGILGSLKWLPFKRAAHCVRLKVVTPLKSRLRSGWSRIYWSCGNNCLLKRRRIRLV